MSHSMSLWQRIQLYLHVAVWSVLLTAAGAWLTVYLLGTLGDPLGGRVQAEEAGAEASQMQSFDSLVALTERKVDRYLGEWEFSEPHLPGHFHHVGRWYEVDTWSYCVDCHGPMPHSRSPQVRAFLNMHNLFVTCRACHCLDKEGNEPSRFGWARVSDGELVANPGMVNGVWGEYGAKIVPLEGPEDNPRPLSLEEESDISTRMQSLTSKQKVMANRLIHRRCSDAPVTCKSCHNQQEPFLRYGELGYSAERAAFLVSAEVVDLVQRYEAFYMPSMLKPDAEGRDESEKSEGSEE